MKKKITKELKNEILLTLKNKSFEVTSESKLGKIFNIEVRTFELFGSPKNIKIDRDCKIELLHWLKQGYIETDESLFAKTVTPPTFLDIMIAATSQTDED